ncbi:MAG: succinate dehydrogenase, cytochrome b556 subunit [Bacteroidetes bacterium QS_8_68_15]|nr:MAG: succinate dehydrogenase, cytochrome b556 subunit [Bacteroidetes bacterium QS_8_68_15]
MATETEEHTGLSEAGGTAVQSRPNKERPQENPGRFQRYRIHKEMFAWMLHRLTGVAIVVYLAIHVWGLKSITNREAYNALIAKYHGPLYVIGEFLLLGAVIYHALNGLRIVLIDFLGWHPHQGKLYWTLGAVAVVLFAVGGYPLLAALLEHFLGGS